MGSVTILTQSSLTTYCFTIASDKSYMRLDQALPSYIAGFSREQARKYIQIGAVWINDNRVQVLSKKVKPGDEVVVYAGHYGYRKYYEANQHNIIYKDEHLLCYRKEPGIPTQPLRCDAYNNLYAALLRYLKAKGKPAYAGMHHRLDLETSGVILFTLSKSSNRNIHYQFRDHKIKKSYLAIVKGFPMFAAKAVMTYIGRQGGKYTCSLLGPGKSAITRFTTLREYDDWALIRAEPQTGRTHQIRLQLAFLGHPVLGDPLYGDGHTDNIPRTMLHAEKLIITHPVSGKELSVQAELFDDMRHLIGDTSIS
jgi:23S rRNA pseudouridine1911/1915/1917 synthase